MSMPFKRKHNPITCIVCVAKLNKMKSRVKLGAKKKRTKAEIKKKDVKKKIKSKSTVRKVKSTSKKYLDFSEFVNKLKGKKQKVVEYPDKLDPEYIPVKNLFKKK